jgi:hypothetical protein
MKKAVLLLSAVVLFVLVFLVGSLVFAQAPGDEGQAGDAAQGSDSNPVGTPEVVIPEQYQPRAVAAPQAATPASTVYFTPQDENTSTTILFLYNTNTLTETVGLQTFYINGSLTISTTVAVPPKGLVRISADTVTTVSASWASYVLINFTTFSAYAKMTVPTGVKADGYVAWDTTGIYDPLTALQTLPLRFSADPPSVFLPVLSR